MRSSSHRGDQVLRQLRYGARHRHGPSATVTRASQRSPSDDASSQGAGVPVTAHHSPLHAHRPNALSEAREYLPILSDCPPQMIARPVWTCRVVSPGSDCPPDSWSQGPVSPPVPTAALWRRQPPAMLGLLHSSPGQPQSLSAPGRPCPLHLSVLGTKLGAYGGRPNPSWVQQPGGAPSPPPCDVVCEPAPSHGSLAR